jgi:outer membrane biosynthesis protein TonB
MRKFNWLFTIYPFLILFTVYFIACESSNNKEETTGTETDTVTVTQEDPQGVSTFRQHDINERNADWYTYDYRDADPVDQKNAQKVKSSENKNAPKAKARPVVYSVSQTDRPPLFSKDCLTAEDPEKCSNEALKAWVRDHVEYPEQELQTGTDGLEYVTFIINQEGRISSVRRVESKMESCEGCSQAALSAVLKMPDWEPARLDGKPVSVVVTLPVRFRAL